MDGQYLVVNVIAAGRRINVGYRGQELQDARQSFNTLSQNDNVSVLLYNSVDDLAVNITIKSEPILLVNAIEFARGDQRRVPANVENAAFLMNLISESLNNGRRGQIDGNIIEPYFVRDLNLGANLGGLGGGFFGVLAGVVIGLAVGGPIGAIAGGVAGGVSGGGGTRQLIKFLAHPRQCRACTGSGFQGNLNRCGGCGGLGYNQ